MPEDVSTTERAAIRTDIKLSEESFLSDEFVRQLVSVGEIDIMVGLPTHNSAKTIGPAVTAIQDGIVHWFPRERAAIINADGGSRDGTPDLVVNAAIDDVRQKEFNRRALRTLPCISARYGNTPERGTALRTILAAGDLLGARAATVISPDSDDVKPEWLPVLLSPVLKEGVDLVLPTYSRHKFDGLLITNLLYPMSRALFGLRIREPFALDFAFSNNLGSQFLAQNSWNDESVRAASEIRFTIAAVTGGFRICQSFLGTKPHVERRSGDLVPALRQTIGPLFSAMESTFALWGSKTGSEPIPTLGQEPQFTVDPVRVNRKRLAEMFRAGVSDLQSVFQAILSAGTLAELQRISQSEETDFEYPAELWVKTVYEFAAAYRKAVISRDHIIQALAPLFRGRALTCLIENRSCSATDVENQVENLCLEFERLKPYLLDLWNGKA
jgi:hypothetical protein